ncbi:MAG: RHS repeat-associated core domain-containing protein [Candidatus Woesearchaeota archaeon]
MNTKFTALILSSLIATFCIPTAFALSYNLTYDNNGNLIQGIGNYYEYDEFNQLVRIRNENVSGDILEEYNYDYEGNRIRKIRYNTDGSNTTYYYIGNDFVRVINSSGTFDLTYYYDGNNIIAKNDTNGELYFFHPDHLGSTSVITDENGDVIGEVEYYPFGGVLSGSDADGRLYTGKEKDSGVLYYYGARYYDSDNLMRFTQPDSIIPDIYNPQDLNRYAYVRNNPYKYVDFEGKQTKSVFDSPISRYLAVYLEGQENKRLIREKLHKELRNKYDPLLPREATIRPYYNDMGFNVMRINRDIRMDFQQLQNIELENEFEIHIIENDQMVGFSYKNEQYKGNMKSALNVLEAKGFERRIVKTYISEQFKLETGRIYSNIHEESFLQRFITFFKDNRRGDIE